MTTETHPQPGAAAFCTTRWTRVCLAKAESPDGRAALGELCAAYYEPVVAFLRCELRDADGARELSHAFFTEILQGGAIRSAAPERGRFRSYLLGAVKHFVARHRAAERRLKRGGGAEVVTLEDEEALNTAESRRLTPDAEFDRQWAVTVLARGLEALREQCSAEGRAEFFQEVKPLLTGDASHGDQAALAASCGLELDAFRMAVHRLRKRLRQCVKAEIASTLDAAGDVQAEMDALFAALGG